MSEKRQAPRLVMNTPCVVEVVGQREAQLHPALAAVYERVRPSTERLGDRFPGVLRDLSTNGAFVTATPLPLLSRISMTFVLDGHGQVEVLAWTLWRRSSDCQVPRSGSTPVILQAGFGLLFEAISLEARVAIAERVR